MEMLDSLDRKVLFELDRNASQSYSDLARKLRQGRDRVSYRVERLIEEKIIERFSIQINLYKLGYTIFKIYFRLENQPERVAELMNYVEAHPRAYWVARSEMSWDLMLAMFAKTPAEFHTLSTKLLSKFNDIIITFSMYTVVNLQTYSRGYFSNVPGTPALLTGAQSDFRLDKTDYAILRMLADDCRQPISTMADKIESTSAIVKYRIERMEQQGVIAAYRIDLNRARMGVMLFKSEIYVRSHSSTQRKQLESFIQNCPEVVAYVEQLGDCMIELEFEVRDYEQYYKLIDSLRAESAKLVRNFQSSFIRRTHVGRLPPDLDLS